MKIIWDSSQFMITINYIDIHIAPEHHPPVPIQATVVEQDTSLILEPDEEIRDPGTDKPIWYMANLLEHQRLHKPGDIIYKPGSPIKLWAVIHDLEQTPSWHQKWIEKALENIIGLCERKNITSICLPVLGSQFGHFQITNFILLLVKTLKASKPVTLKRIWLVVPEDACQTVFTLLKTLSTNE